MVCLSFPHSVCLTFPHSVCLSFPHSVSLSFPHSVSLNFPHSVCLNFPHSVYLSFPHSFYLSFPHSVSLSFPHSVCLRLHHPVCLYFITEAEAAQFEAGLRPECINGFVTPMTTTPSTSQYHTPASTPDTFNSNYPMNVVKSSNELFSEFVTLAGQQDGTSCSGSDSTSLAGSLGECGESGIPLAPPPPPAPPLPGIPPPPAPPPPGMDIQKKCMLHIEPYNYYRRKSYFRTIFMKKVLFTFSNC